MFIVTPLCGIYSAPSVTSISEGGSYKTLTATGHLDGSYKPGIFQIENATSIQFQTRELCDNAGIHTFYWVID